jgi:hypothetical protein
MGFGWSDKEKNQNQNRHGFISLFGSIRVITEGN